MTARATFPRRLTAAAHAALGLLAVGCASNAWSPPPDGGSCYHGALSIDRSSSAMGSTAGGQDQFRGCGGAGAPDLAFSFWAPYTGTFIAEVAAAGFRPALSARRGTCYGPELACERGRDDHATSLTLALRQHETVALVVDGQDGGSGEFVLSVHAAPMGDGGVRPAERCADCDLGEAVGDGVFQGSTQGAGNDFHLCGEHAVDLALRWTAPETATYRFTLPMSGRAGLALLADSCTGPTLRCVGPTYGDVSTVASLAAGQTVIVVIENADSWRQTVQLDVRGTRPDGTPVPERAPRGTCPQAVPDGGAPDGGRCPAPSEILCNGACIDPSHDSAHCGSCGNRCPDSSYCSNGRCVLACPLGRGDCDGNAANGCETDLRTGNDCGACGRQCAPGTTCEAAGGDAHRCCRAVSTCVLCAVGEACDISSGVPRCCR